jgi:hypothetical protein
MAAARLVFSKKGGTDVKDDVKIDDLFGQINDLKKEIASLREDLADKLQAYDSGPDFAKIRSLLDEGISVVTQAVRPIEEKIAVHPLAAMTIALGAGIVIGRAVCRSSGSGGEKRETTD